MDEKEYEVTITEVLEKKVRYRGRNELEATAKAEADYYAEKIVLGADDFSYRDISAKELVPVKEEGTADEAYHKKYGNCMRKPYTGFQSRRIPGKIFFPAWGACISWTS